MKPFFLVFILFLITISSLSTTQTLAEVDPISCVEELNLLSTQIMTLEEKLTNIQDLLQTKATEPKEHEFWKGNQSTFGSFRRLSHEAKRKLLTFQLGSTEDLEVSTLLEELRPCTNLESIELNQVELVGTFPNTSTNRLTLPKLYEFKLILSNYPNDDFPNVMFFQKELNAKHEFEIGRIARLKTDITISFSGLTKFSIDHDFGELIIDQGPSTVLDLSAANLNVFRLKKLTLQSMVLNTSQVPTDLSYLNLKYVSMNGHYKPGTDYNDLVKKLKSLKSLHIDTKFDGDFAAVLDLADLPFYLKAISLRHMRVNISSTPLMSNIETLLLDSCLLDDKVIDSLPRSLRNIKKVVIESYFVWQSEVQCHWLLYNLVRSGTDLRKLESIQYAGCRRYIKPEFQSQVKHYDEMEEFLTNLGLGQSSDFYLQRQTGNNGEWVWSGRNTTKVDSQRAKYELSDWNKSTSWEYYSRF